MDMRARPVFVALAWVAVVTFGGGEPTLHAEGIDPAARGLDVLIHAPTEAVAGAAVPIDVRAYGFIRATTAAPLAKATVRVAWDPESIGLNTAPPDVEAVTDALGNAHLDVVVPEGMPGALQLLVALESGEHSRVRKLEIKRAAAETIEIDVPDTHIVPGSDLPSWVTLRSALTGAPVRDAEVEVVLREGDVTRAVQRGKTDSAGIMRSQIAIPAALADSRVLSLGARRLAGVSNERWIALALREEAPGTPKLIARFQEPSLRPGATGHATIRIEDATGERLVNHPLRYWTGPRGAKPPISDLEWNKLAKSATTDGTGELALEVAAPRVVTAAGSDVTLAVRAELDGQWLTQTATLPVALPVASANARVEGGALVPGLRQRVFLEVIDEESPGASDYEVDGDNLRARVRTDADGNADFQWDVPANVGAARSVGPCAGGVAATLVMRRAPGATQPRGRASSFELCVPVDRERRALLRTNMQIATIGDKLHAKVDTAADAKGSRTAATSFVVTGPSGAAGSQWSATREADLDLGGATPGLHTITAVTPQPGGAASTVAGQVLVRPRVLPHVRAQRVGGATGPVAPGSEIAVDVTLDDGHGHPLRGAIAGVVIDREGGGSTAGFEALDTRTSLCRMAAISADRCSDALEGSASTERVRAAALTTSVVTGTAPATDPEATAAESLRETFSTVLHSLEGAVFEATKSPDSLRDVRRRQNGRWMMNPELMTLVTSAMSDQPETPGGEPFTLADLLAVDSQVTFDNVARRVTRLKLFRVLSAIRTFKNDQTLGHDEPLLRDPAALLRRLVRTNVIAADALLDPWGGTLGFVRAAGAPTPFLTATPGWELRSPGPDGQLGNGDDVRDPFERVVRTGTPYAAAMGEDEIVDAKWDMKVADSTVDNWTHMFDRLTGTELGAGGLGLGGVGTSGGGSGQGSGSGRGRVGSVGRSLAGITTGVVSYVPPVVTDAAGHATLRLRLGDVESTWRTALIARTDDGQTAVTTLDVSSQLPFSVHVDAGRRLVIGDAVGARVVVRNRSTTLQRATVTLGAEGGLALAKDQPRSVVVDVPPRSTRSFFAGIDARAVGIGRIMTRLEAGGALADAGTYALEVFAAAEARLLMTSALVTHEESLAVAVPERYVLEGAPRLILESSFRGALLAALEGVEPRGNTPPDALADSLEVAARIQRFAELTKDDVLAGRARDASALAKLYLLDHGAGEGARARVAVRRAHAFGFEGAKSVKDGCPPDEDGDRSDVIAWLEAEPAPGPRGPLACATALLSKVHPKSALELARTVSALAERPHRNPLVGPYAVELAKLTTADGADLAVEGTRAERAIVVAALVRTAATWSAHPKEALNALLSRLVTLRDARGGYGSTEATRDVVRALVHAQDAATDSNARASRVRVTQGDRTRVVDVSRGSAQTVPLETGQRAVRIVVDGGPIVARIEQRARRPWLGETPTTTPAAVDVTVAWPEAPRAGTTDSVYVKYKLAGGRPLDLETRLTLPAGATLAAPVANVRLRQGELFIRTTVKDESAVALPIRFANPGRMLAPESETFVRSEDEPRALSVAQRLVVRPGTP